MIGKISELHNQPAARIASQANSAQRVVWAYVVNINKISQTMTVRLRENNEEIPGIPINNMMSQHGIGVRIIPVPRDTIVILLKLNEEYIHIGYALQNLDKYTQDSSNSKVTNALLQRYLDEGEVQLLGIANNEILLTNDGSVLIKTQNNSYVKLEEISSTFEGFFSNLKFEMDGVRIRAGNMRRPIKGAQKEDDYIVYSNETEEVKKATDLEETEEGEFEDHTYFKEFTVQVGTVMDTETGIDKPFDQRDPAGSSPQIGWISLANQVIDETGEEYKIEGQNVQFVLRTANGGGLAITEDNSLYLLDYSPGTTGGKNFTKFSTKEDSSKGIRTSDNNFIDIGNSGIKILHNGGSIDVKLDSSGNPELSLNTGDGKGIVLNSFGTLINATQGYATVEAKEFQVNAEKITFGGMKAAVTGDSLLKAKQFITEQDLHQHAGPAGPPTKPLMPLVLAGTLTATGVNVG
jgi:hypothetical protein